MQTEVNRWFLGTCAPVKLALAWLVGGWARPVTALLLGFSAAFAGEEPDSPSVVSLAIDATVSPEGRVLLRAEIRLGEDALEEVDPTAFEINRTSHTGEALWFPAPVGIEGGIEDGAVSLDWTDSSVERGSAYRYYLEYFSSDVCLSSNVVFVCVPEMPPEGEASEARQPPERTGLYVEVAGPDYAQTDKPFLVTARPSRRGGVVSWECLTPSICEVLLTQGRNAMLVSRSVAPGPIWRVSYTLDDETAHGFYRPRVVCFELVGGYTRGPWTPEHARRLRKRIERKAIRRRHIQRMRTAEGASELRQMVRFAFLGAQDAPASYLVEYVMHAKEVARSVIKQVGSPAIAELHAGMRGTSEPVQKGLLAKAITEIDEAYSLSSLWPEALEQTDICVADYLSHHNYEDSRSSEVQRMLVSQLGSSEEYLCILACLGLAWRKLVTAAPALAELSRLDESPLVRFWARHAFHCLERRIEPMRLHLPMSVSEIDEREIGLARQVFAELRDGIGNGGGSLNTPGSARFRFRAFGSATVPIIGERLCEPDCGELEMRIYGEVLRDVACDLPQRTREHFAQVLWDAQKEDRAGVFARYKEVVRNISEGYRCWRFIDLHKPYGREQVERLLGGNEADRCYLVAGLSVCFDSLADQKRPVARWVPSWASEEQKARLRKSDKLDAWLAAREAARDYHNKLRAADDLAGQLAAEFLTPPSTETPKLSE